MVELNTRPILMGSCSVDRTEGTASVRTCEPAGHVVPCETLRREEHLRIDQPRTGVVAG